MHTIAKLAAGLTTAALTVATSPMASADPVIPLDPVQLPGLAAVQNLSPVVQQAATDPASAQELLLAAASQLAGNATTPGGSTALAEAVTRFVQHGGAAMGPAAPPASAAVTQQAATGMPHGTAPLLTPGPGNGPIPLQQHVPAAGVVPGAEAHLPTGINPAHAAGPVPEAMPEVPTAVAAPSPAPAPGSAPAAADALAYDPNTPPTQDFLYPSMSNGCLKDGGNVIATAISVAGPAAIPTPGPGAGQTAYVFTAVGTPAPAAEQKLPLNVTWVNLTNGRSGSATLKPNPGINPEGPTTLTAIVDTGSGSIMSTIFGQVTTTDMQCTFMPTIGSSVVP
ncbi:MAG: hypothetical protein K0U67_08605 [Actinomycetia bacterium]|nr:hypothetical protein [Actinomycetes bacterium]